MLCATQLNPNQLNHYFTALPVRAREHQIRAPKKHIIWGLGRGSYSHRVTVYPYNGHIRSTNPIVRHVMSLTWIMKRMHANQRTAKHAATQPLHGSNTRAQAQSPKKPVRWRLAAHATSHLRAAGTLVVPTAFRKGVCHILGKKMHLQWEIKDFYFRSVSSHGDLWL